MRAKEMMLQSVPDEDLKKWIWRARSSATEDAPQGAVGAAALGRRGRARRTRRRGT